VKGTVAPEAQLIGWRFLLSKRWAGYLALTIIFSIVCVGLCNWQLARRADALAENNKVSANYDATPVPVAEALPALDSFDEAQKWLRVELTGQYLPDDQILVRNRPNGGQPGFEILAPFRTVSGDVFLVDRGWLPIGTEQDRPDVVPAPPTGTATVTARLKPTEPQLANQSPAPGEIGSIYLPEIAKTIGKPTFTAAYGLLDTETPSADTGMLTTRPIEDEGPHLSYAFQWIVFAVLAFAFLGYAARQEYRHVNADDPDERERAEERERRRLEKARRKDDSVVEDEILDEANHR
jgi:cytochrome oxidase assembly protein ShyY1